MKPLRDTRTGLTHGVKIYGEEGETRLYIRTGVNEDNQLSEVFIDVGLEGSTEGGLVDTIAILISKLLRSGIPVENICKKLKFQRCSPCGMTNNKDIPMCSSIQDYIGKWLEKEYGHEQEIKCN